jgi:hypothetical protein
MLPLDSNKNGCFGGRFFVSKFVNSARFRYTRRGPRTVAPTIYPGLHAHPPPVQRARKRNATIRYGGLAPEVCLADLYQGDDDISGRRVLLDIRQSTLGFTLRELRLAP